MSMLFVLSGWTEMFRPRPSLQVYHRVIYNSVYHVVIEDQSDIEFAVLRDM